jgi:class 3 adenylate cyclase/tetratricopeptide (TPR) repeat protein
VSATAGTRDSAVDALRPFVPRIAVDWLRESPGAITRSFDGTLVFADVSGFTELTEKLSRRGREGAEEIARVLDAAFSELIAAAYAHHADLLKFGGDAVLLLFRGESHENRAATAALAMQDALAGMRRLRTSAGPVRLGMSVGAHTGTFHFFLVGGVHRELIVAGRAATACVETEGVARSGEVALSGETAERFPAPMLGEVRDGAVLLAGNPHASEIVPPYFDPSGLDLAQLLPAAYTRELRGEPADPEHRHVAVGFVEIGGTDELLESEGADALGAELEERITSIQESCLGFDVTFAQTDVSRGAVKAILLAGAPRSAGGDEEELMLRTARAIVERPGALPVRVGVQAGRVFAGIVGPTTRRTYTFYGDAVNTAARIMARAADGQALAEESVLDRARTTYLATPVEPFAAKGKAEPVRAVDLGPAMGEREMEASGPLVGREEELAELLSALDRARNGEGSLVVLRGEQGFGKTRLLAELRRQAGTVRAVRVHCSQLDEGEPYRAAGAVLKRALQLGPHAPDTEVERRLRGAVGVAAQPLEPYLPLLGLVVGLDLPATPETDALDERFVPDRIAESVQTLLDGLVPDAALVVVDDGQHMDEASAELFTHVASGIRERRWLLVVARSGQDGGFEPHVDLGALTVEVGPLGRADAVALVQRLTEDAPLPAHVANAIATRSTGSPLFVTEMVGAVRHGADLDALPQSVEALMAVQIDELASADRGLLRQASVLGSRFTREGFAVALGLAEADAEAVLDRLGTFLVADGEGGMRFRHGLLRDTAYHGLSYRRRRALHRRVGEALERDAGDATAAAAPLLARHFYAAGLWDKALGYGTLAGRAARGVHATTDAAHAFAEALDAGRRWRGARAEAIALVAEELGDVRVTLGELEGAREAFRAALRRVHGDVVERARLTRKVATSEYLLGRYEAASRLLVRSTSLLHDVQSTPAGRQRARATALLGMVAYRRGRPLQAADWFQRAIAESEAAGERKALAHALYGLDLADAALGRFDNGGHSTRALEIYQELGDLGRAAGVLNNLGLLAYYRGRWDDALSYYRQAREAWERAGDRSSVSMASFNIGEILVAQGRLDEAAPLLRDAVRASHAASEATAVAETTLELARLSAFEGDLDTSLRLLGDAGRIFGEMGERGGLVLVQARTAEAYLLGEQWENAVRVATDTLDSDRSGEADALVRPILLRVAGEAHARLGRDAVARGMLEDAVSAAEAADYRYEVALSLDAIARMGEDATVRVRRDALFAELGLDWSGHPRDRPGEAVQ